MGLVFFYPSQEKQATASSRLVLPLENGLGRQKKKKKIKKNKKTTPAATFFCTWRLGRSRGRRRLEASLSQGTVAFTARGLCRPQMGSEGEEEKKSRSHVLRAHLQLSQRRVEKHSSAQTSGMEQTRQECRGRARGTRFRCSTRQKGLGKGFLSLRTRRAASELSCGAYGGSSLPKVGWEGSEESPRVRRRAPERVGERRSWLGKGRAAEPQAPGRAREFFPSKSPPIVKKKK